MKASRSCACVGWLGVVSIVSCASSSTPPAAPEASGGAAALDPTSTETAEAAGIEQSDWGSHEGQPVHLYTLINQNGLVLKVTNFGATVTELHVPDASGKLGDVVLGFDSLDGYRKQYAYIGATVGRVANRIRGSRFSLDGVEFPLPANDGENHLHGGPRGFDEVVWSAEAEPTTEGPRVRLSYVSPAGDQGYPGTLSAQVTYTLTNDNTLRVVMSATTDAPTIVNLAHHGYWNLGGHDSGSIADHELVLYADDYTPGDPQIPTGAVVPVAGTPYDFRQPRPVGRDFAELTSQPVGYDTNWVVRGEPGKLRPVARLRDPKSGRVLTLEADQPGVQLYTGNYLDGSVSGKGGVAYAQHGALCLETQKFPNAINVPEWADQVVLRPGQAYEHTMVHRFSVE